MARRDAIEPEPIGPVEQPVELQVPVALDTRVRCRPHAVRRDVRTDDLAHEVVTEVEDGMIDAELLGDAARVVDVAHRAATAIAVAAPQLHRDADDLVPGFEEQRGRDRRVDAARHGDHHLHGTTCGAS